MGNRRLIHCHCQHERARVLDQKDQNEFKFIVAIPRTFSFRCRVSLWIGRSTGSSASFLAAAGVEWVD